LLAMWEFALAGHEIVIVVGNHDVELLQPEVAQCLGQMFFDLASPKTGQRTEAAEHRRLSALGRIRVAPWFVYEPGVVWIEHGHQYDEACSFEFGLAPWQRGIEGEFLINVDYAAVRYLATTAPELDAHGAEQWSTVGYVRYAASHGGVWAFVKSYVAFVASMLRARRLHRSNKDRDTRRRWHQEQVRKIADDAGVSLAVAQRIDRLSRAPLTVSLRRLLAMLALDVWGVLAASILVGVLLLIFAPWYWIVMGGAAVGFAARALLKKFAGTHVASQLPMRRIPEQIAAVVDAPLVVFGHTHDPMRISLPSGGEYMNCGTWLPAARPGLMRSFTFVKVIVDQPGTQTLSEPTNARLGSVEPEDRGRYILQWTDGMLQRFSGA
jgi:hypothetical protein